MNLRNLKDTLASRLMWTLALASSSLVVVIALALLARARPILAVKPLATLLFSSDWHPLKGQFGFFPFIIGTLWVTGLAMLLAVPASVLTAIYLSEYARSRVREALKPLIDLLAGIPSVVYGVWGVLVVVPLIKDHLAPLFGTFSTGYCVLAGGIVLAIMVLPLIIHVSTEVLSTVPLEVREASLALGATKWQTIRHAVVRKARPGVVAAVVLGFSRAFGETMAILMVVGNVPSLPKSLLDPAYPLPALIANNYGEMMSIPLYDSALLLASLILLLVVLAFCVLARTILLRTERGIL